jgi:multisubunit Na+/H+ antiporter MnhB subunit
MWLIYYYETGLTRMKSNSKAFIALGLGLIFLSFAISTNQFELIQEIIAEITKSATAGLPLP